MLEGINQYYSEELSQKTKRGMRETRIKGNFMGGRVNYGYSIVKEIIGEQTVSKVTVNEEEAAVLLQIFEAYAGGNRIPDIVRELEDKGIRNRGRPFTVNTIYFMLQNEKYTGIYNFRGETFTNIYPSIIPKDLFQIVRERVNKNKTGKHVVGVDYILMGKCYCGYCGKRLRSAAGTTTDGTIFRYYRCPSAKKDTDCRNKSIRKEVLEKIVTDALTEEVARPENISLLSDKVFELYRARGSDDGDLKRYEKELAATDKAINNLLAAIENGIFTPSTKQRLTELEEKKARLEQSITIESAREKCLLTKEDIERYILDAVKLNAKQMVELLVERIDVFEDKICIKLKYSDTPPDGTNKQNDKELMRDFENEEIDAPNNDNMNETNRRGGDENPRRGGFIFVVKKSYRATQKRRYRSGRIRTFTCTLSFTIEFYI